LNPYIRSILVIFLFSIVIFNAAAQNKYYAKGEIVYTIAETVPVKNKGFLHYAVEVGSNETTTFIVNFFNLKAEKTYSHRLPLPKLIYLGNANNGSQYVFLFHDLNNRLLYYIIFSEEGKSVVYQKKAYKAGLRESMIFFYDDNAFYTDKKVGNRNTITKISYKTDTIWSQDLDDKETKFFLHKVKKRNDRLYLDYSGTKLFCLDDASGKQVFNTDLSDEIKIRQFYNFLPLENGVVVAGEELERKKRKPENDLFFSITLDNAGKATSKQTYRFPAPHNPEAKTTFVRDIVENGNSVKIVGETITKTKGNSALIGYAIAGAMAAITGVGVGPNTASGFITGYEISVLSPHTENLEVKGLPKAAIEKFYNKDLGHAGHEMHGFLNDLNAFDYQFSAYKEDGSVSLFYLSDLKESSLEISEALINGNELFIKAYTVETNLKNVASTNILQISDNSLLVVLSEKVGVRFKIVDIK
jgi:hypothetical protein